MARCKSRLFSVLWLLFLCFSVSKPKKVQSAISSAIKTILNGTFADFPSHIDVVVCEAKKGASESLIQHTLHQKQDVFITKISNCKADDIKLNTSTFLAFDSPEIFNEIADRIIWQTNKSKRYRHLVYISNGTADDIDASIQDGWRIDNVAFLVNETEESIDLVTSFMFTEKKCRESQLETINRFDKNIEVDKRQLLSQKVPKLPQLHDDTFKIGNLSRTYKHVLYRLATRKGAEI